MYIIAEGRADHSHLRAGEAYDPVMIEEIEQIEREIAEKLCLMGFEERAYRIIRSFYTWQLDVDMEEMDEDKINLVRDFGNWFYAPAHMEEKIAAHRRVERELGVSIADMLIPLPETED